jgi:hypothetical protein
MSMSKRTRKARVLRNFHVYVEPATKGEREARRDFAEGEVIDCTPEQLEVGEKAGLLEAAAGEQFPERAPEATA